MMELNMTEKQFRRLLDLVYIGNWVLNSTRGDDRIKEYDQVESLVFAHCLDHGMAPLTELYQGELIPSRAFADGGIHEAIMAYEDATFFEILAQELALRDIDDPPITPENYDEIMARMANCFDANRHTVNHESAANRAGPEIKNLYRLVYFCRPDHFSFASFPRMEFARHNQPISFFKLSQLVV